MLLDHARLAGGAYESEITQAPFGGIAGDFAPLSLPPIDVETMKQSLPAFSFKKNLEVHALPVAIPTAPSSLTASAPRKTEKPKTRQVSCYLTEEEFAALLTKLDGRPITAVVRNLVLQYAANA